ncbi:hypothetical protein ACHAW5_002639 [Stephanodiscus triporus]|uniref:Plastid lipid-associated protein/fibrillin conserved domain-containing protein n=1 Tax=Stephanodiscus triporus TaxID=2934178 RepID=A0ABD3NNF9_9STRA
MASPKKATTTAAALAAATTTTMMIFAIVQQPTAVRGFFAPPVLPSGGRAARMMTPLHATESFQRSLLEARFANKNAAPDSASPKKITIVDDDVTEKEHVDDGKEKEKEKEKENLRIQNSILRIAASTDRGQNADSSQKESVSALIASLESSYSAPKKQTPPDEEAGANIIIIPSYMTGTWELLYSNTQLFRSSPFFLAGRSTCKTNEEAKRYDWFCDMHRAALAISTIGNVRQVITKRGGLINEFEVKVGAVPFLSDLVPGWKYSGGLPLTIDGAIVSAADVSPVPSSSSSRDEKNPMEWEVHMDTVEIRGSNVPILRNILDSENVRLRSRDLSKVLEDNVESYVVPRPVLRTTYVDDGMRIVRDMDDNVYIYGRVSTSEEPTDYSGVLPDLGVASLLEGFNDAIAKIYL